MSSDWTRYRLEELGHIVTGKTPPSKVQDAFSDSGVPFVTPRDMDGRRWIDRTERYLSETGVTAVNKSLVPKNSVAVSCIGSDMGKAVLVSCDSVTNQQINTIVVDTEKFNPVFIYYVLSTQQDALKSIAGGSATPILNKGHFGKFEIKLPTKDEQDRLVEYLDCLDSKFELNTQTNQTLEQIAQALYKSWFVDFDPVKAKIAVLEAGGTAEDAELAAMSIIAAKSPEQLIELKQANPDAYEQLAQTAALFSSAMQESELGDIPEGWEVSEIGSEVSVVGGGTPSTKNTTFWEGGSIHWTTPKDMSALNSKVLTNTSRKITPAGLKKISSGLLPVNTVLISSRAPVGYLALAKIPVAVNQGYIAMKCEGRLSPEFVMLWCEQNMAEIKQRASGTTFAEISKANFKPIKILVPRKDIVENFTAQATDIFASVTSNIHQSNSLSATRDLLLPELLAGNRFAQLGNEA